MKKNWKELYMFSAMIILIMILSAIIITIK